MLVPDRDPWSPRATEKLLGPRGRVTCRPWLSPAVRAASWVRLRAGAASPLLAVWKAAGATPGLGNDQSVPEGRDWGPSPSFPLPRVRAFGPFYSLCFPLFSPLDPGVGTSVLLCDDSHKIQYSKKKKKNETFELQNLTF